MGSDEQRAPAGWRARPTAGWRRTATQASTTDPAAHLARTGTGTAAKRWLAGHRRLEQRTGVAVAVLITHATGTADREAARVLLDRQPGHRRRVTLAADQASDPQDCAAAGRQRPVPPPVAQHTSGRHSAIAGRTTRHPGSGSRQRSRQRVAAVCGWTTTSGGGCTRRYRGRARNPCWAELTTAAANRGRLVDRLPAAPSPAVHRPPRPALSTDRGTTPD